MEKTKITNETLIQNTLPSTLSYSKYLEHIEEELEKVYSTEEEKTMQEYTSLNATRMSRLDRTLRIPQEVEDKIAAISQKLYWIVITEGWCGDAAQSVPMLNKLQELNPYIELKIVLRDQNLTLMDRYLTNGGRSIPKLIIYDPKTERVLGTWGPRPAGATKLLEDYRAAHGVIDDDIKLQLQKWYNKDKGHGLMTDIVALHESMNL